MQIYVHKNNQQLGPFTEAEIRAQLAAGTLSLQDHVWWQGQATWLPLGQSSLIAPTAPGAPGATFVPTPIPTNFEATPGLRSGTSQLAIWSLVCGCLGLLCGLFTSIPAIILGHMSLAEIRRNPALEGRGMAMAGLIIGYLFVGLFVVSIIAIITLASLGNNVQDMFKTITSQLNAAQATNGSGNSSNSDDSSTTNSDSSTNSAPTTSDSSTNSAPTKLDGQ